MKAVTGKKMFADGNVYAFACPHCRNNRILRNSGMKYQKRDES
jgi:predicted RNA-binding Zn-ribbon protein involved in translation (DUF1610 family)